MHKMDVTEDDDEDIEHHEESIIDKATDDENVDDADDDYTFNENQCHLCKKHLSNKDELWDHMECIQDEYYREMVEMTAKMRS